MRMRLGLVAAMGVLATISGCSGALKEASAEFDSNKLKTLLVAIEPLIQKGFSERQIEEVANSFPLLVVGKTKHLVFPITYGGVETELHVLVRKEDVDVVELHFLCTPALAEQLQHTINGTDLDSSDASPSTQKP